jgi:primosomal protein N'
MARNDAKCSTCGHPRRRPGECDTCKAERLRVNHEGYARAGRHGKTLALLAMMASLGDAQR